ncbi:carbamoyltransferase family protein [Candidatus Pelagibacter sp. HIMB1542]|uniref:carbamoyltransferase family protein n=1 Tax=Candidatus Pelagibacter sp. HIMB1542 TaxID=3413346 RepID=UPI003F8416B1
MIILGLNLFHADTSACLIVDNKIVAAVEEERFSRIKHFSGVPIDAIKYCLKAGGLKLNDIDIISTNFNRRHNLIEKITYVSKNFRNLNIYKRIYDWTKRGNLKKILEDNINSSFKGKIEFIPHHFAHIASSYFSSKFEECIGLSIDGTGDFSSLEIFRCKNNSIELLEKVNYPHSIGILYQSITQLLGFKKYGDEYKIMGLSALGEPIYLDKFRKLLKFDPPYNFELNQKYFNLNSLTGYSFEGSEPYFPNLYSENMYNLFDISNTNQKKIDIVKTKNIAASLQLYIEIIITKIIKNLDLEFDFNNLCLSGGVIFNSVLNGKISKQFNSKKIFLHNNSGDAGGAIGAALFSKSKNDKNFKKIKISSYLGPKYSQEYVLEFLKNSNLLSKFNYKIFNSDEELVEAACGKILEDNVIAWYQSNMEWGPRALGNRSFLADPRLDDIKDRINLKIKLREDFRPFAPSVLNEDASDYFETENNVDYSNMTFVVKAKKKAKDNLPGIVHVDGTSRVQTVSPVENKLFYKLLNQFKSRTGHGVILNTSFNVNEPIVESPQDAMNTFFRTNLNSMFIENILVSKK